jgi:anthranilate synthase/indole-3-glycerol phosphate synthase/phosphoribosylanthranilate isomerase
VSEGTILDRIVAQRRKDVAEAKLAVPFATLQEQVRQAPPAIDFVARLRRDAPMALIAEIKRASPSKGDIAPGIDAAGQGWRYASAGAAGISVLTESAWFKGKLDDMLAVRRTVEPLAENRPAILRKDFIVDDYQVLEARAFGADAALLIVACLTDSMLRGLMGCIEDMGMTPVVEVNNPDEMARAVDAGAKFIGVNNRDLRDFSVDPNTTGRLAALAPEGTMLAAFSGIQSRVDVEQYAALGATAVLVGESLMRAQDAASKVRELTGREDGPR